MDTSVRTMDRVPPRRHPRPPLAHGVAHRLSVGRGADPLPPRLSPHRRAQPDPRERPRAGRHAPDRAQEPRHLRPLQHYPRAGTARRQRPTRRVSGAAGAGGANPAAAPHGRTRRPSASYDAAPRKGARGIVNLASCWQSYRMPSYRGYRFPPAIISHAVWLYHRAPQQAVEKMTGGPSKSAVRSRLQTTSSG